MFFLRPLYNLLFQYFAARINHFALIKLSMLALDKTIFYFLLFIIWRIGWRWLFKSHRTKKAELTLWLFTFYLILVLMLTTFRKTYFPWQITLNFNRPLSEINLVFLQNTWKMIYARSHVDFFYNSLGNILCFIPFGVLAPVVFPKWCKFGWIFLAGILFSLAIETMQFLLGTGISDIDDIFFNSCGAALGYGCYWLWYRLRPNFKTN